MEIMEPKEAWIRLHTQEVRGSSPCAPTIHTNGLGVLKVVAVMPNFDTGPPAFHHVYKQRIKTAAPNSLCVGGTESRCLRRT